MSRKSNESLKDPTGADPGKQGLSVAVSGHNGKGFIEPHNPRMEENLKLSSQIPPVAQIALEDANHAASTAGSSPISTRGPLILSYLDGDNGWKVFVGDFHPLSSSLCVFWGVGDHSTNDVPNTSHLGAEPDG